jgi:hypothetical protein
MRRWLSTLAMLALFVAGVEGIFFVFGILSVQRGNPYRLYDAAKLGRALAPLLPREKAAAVTGLAEGEYRTRPHPDLNVPICGSAWGGSFTWADDVSDAEAWPHLLSSALGCQIDNHGIDAFGIDQTLLYFRQYPTDDGIVILGLASPMIIIDGLASHTFMSLNDDKSPRAAPTKARFILDGDEAKLVPRPPADPHAIEHHITGDFAAADWTKFAFPFSLHVARAIYRKHIRESFVDLDTASPHKDMAMLRRLATVLIADFMREARERHNRFAVLLIPSPDYRGDLDPALTEMTNKLAPDLCKIDPTPELSKAASAGSIRTVSGHLTAPANKALADAVVRGLKACGITS